MKNEKLEENSKCDKINGITLISLIITIIVLIILAGVAIYLSVGNNGIFNTAKEAKELTNKQIATEKINLKITTAQMNKYAERQEMPTLKELSEVLRDDMEIAYVTEKSQIASTKYEVGENPSSIYTKLNDYSYEFEINGKLQLASINGIKIAENEESNLFDYSTNEERIVGKWVNGKNVYEKFLDIGNATQYGLVYDGKSQGVSIPEKEICSNIDEIIASQVRCTGMYYNTRTLPFGWGGIYTNYATISHEYSNKKIMLWMAEECTRSENSNTAKIQIIIQYTKTNN